MIDIFLHIAWVLFAVLIAWWLEELGIYCFGIYKYFGVKSAERQVPKKVPKFSSFQYPLELETNNGRIDTKLWNGSGRYSKAIEKLKFLQDISSSRTLEWLAEQMKCTSSYFGQFQDIRDKIIKSLQIATRYEMCMTPIQRGNFYFQMRKSMSNDIRYQLCKSTSLDATGEVVLDTCKLAEYSVNGNASSNLGREPTFLDCWISDDGALVAYGYTTEQGTSGNVLMQIEVRNTVSGKNLDDIITQCDPHSNLVWAPRNAGFYYSVAGPSSRVQYHRLGTKEASDDLIFFKTFSAVAVSNKISISSDGSKLIVHVHRVHDLAEMPNCHSRSSGNALYTINIHNRFSSSVPTEFTELVDNFDDRYEYITCTRDSIWLRTNREAPFFKVVKCCIFLSESEIVTTEAIVTDNERNKAIDPNERIGDHSGSVTGTDNSTSSSPSHVQIARKITNFPSILRDCITEDQQGAFLESVHIADASLLVVKFILHASHSIMLYRLPPSISELEAHEAIPVAELPHSPYGFISGPLCKAGSQEILYSYSGFVDPGSIFSAKVSIRNNHSVDSIEDQTAPSTRPSIGINLNPPLSVPVPGINLSDYEVRQEFVTGSDGVLIPVFIIAANAVFEERCADEYNPRPCLLCVYGGFGVPLLPTISPLLLLFLRHCGGIICVANIRGGGEYGLQWHKDGVGDSKITAVDDFVKVAEYLIENEYSTQKKLGLLGGGVGGIAVGCALNRRPWLFGAAVILDGLLDIVNNNLYSPPQTESIMAGKVIDTAASSVGDTDLPTRFGREFTCSSDNSSSAESSEASISNVELLSPAHSIVNRDIPYPAVLVVATGIELRESYPCLAVAPIQHSFSFTGVLQHAVGARSDQKKPLLLYCSTESFSIECEVNILLFFSENLRAPWLD